MLFCVISEGGEQSKRAAEFGKNLRACVGDTYVSEHDADLYPNLDEVLDFVDESQKPGVLRVFYVHDTDQAASLLRRGAYTIMV